MLRDAAILIGVVSALVLAPRGASAEFHLERHLALEPNGTFTLDSDAGSVTLTGGGKSFTLIYDNPVVGSNSGSVTAPSGYAGSCQVGGGTNATFTYTIGPA